MCHSGGVVTPLREASVSKIITIDHDDIIIILLYSLPMGSPVYSVVLLAHEGRFGAGGMATTTPSPSNSSVVHYTVDGRGQEKLVFLNTRRSGDDDDGDDDDDDDDGKNNTTTTTTTTTTARREKEDKSKRKPLRPYQGHTSTVMMDWETPYMERLVAALKLTGEDDVLEIGFGLGRSASAIKVSS